MRPECYKNSSHGIVKEALNLAFVSPIIQSTRMPRNDIDHVNMKVGPNKFSWSKGNESCPFISFIDSFSKKKKKKKVSLILFPFPCFVFVFVTPIQGKKKSQVKNIHR
jgi:hypothetical protein